MAINLTNLTGINSLYKLGDYAHAVTGEIFWGLIVMVLFIILLVNLRENGIASSLIASSFACVVISLLLLNLEWINLAFPIIFGLITAGTVFYKVFSKN